MPYLLFTLYHLMYPSIRTPPSNLQPIATRGKKARGTLLVDIGCSSKRALPSVSYQLITTKLAAAILVVAVVSS